MLFKLLFATGMYIRLNLSVKHKHNDIFMMKDIGNHCFLDQKVLQIPIEKLSNFYFLQSK